MSRTLSVIRLMRQKYAGNGMQIPLQQQMQPAQIAAPAQSMPQAPRVQPTQAVANPGGVMNTNQPIQQRQPDPGRHIMGRGIQQTGLGASRVLAAKLPGAGGGKSSNPIDFFGPLGKPGVANGNAGGGITHSSVHG